MKTRTSSLNVALIATLWAATAAPAKAFGADDLMRLQTAYAQLEAADLKAAEAAYREIRFDDTAPERIKSAAREGEALALLLQLRDRLNKASDTPADALMDRRLASSIRALLVTKTQTAERMLEILTRTQTDGVDAFLHSEPRVDQ